MTASFDLQSLRNALAERAAALRCITEYQPAGGPGDKIFPATYERGEYATETRTLEGGDRVECVLIDSVQSQANRMELALLEAHRSRSIRLPVIVARFDQAPLLKKFEVTSLEAPHRAADAIFRDSLWKGVMFRKSDKGRVLDNADVRNATGLFGICPSALLFGLWDSTGPRGGLGAKFQRAIVSEVIGIGAIEGRKTSSRIDPAQILLGAGPLYARKAESDHEPSWTLEPAAVTVKLGKSKDGKPSEANHGNVTPSIEAGGFTISRARQCTVISLTALRRLRFPLGGESASRPEVDVAGQAVLASMGLLACAMLQEEGLDLRSRCQLVATGVPTWELLGSPGAAPTRFSVSSETALALLKESIQQAREAGLPWDDDIELTPSAELVELVRRSQELSAQVAGEA